MAHLKGKTAIVTGASKGIGAGVAKRFAAEGARVVVNYASDTAGAGRVVDAIKAEGGEAIAVAGDVSKAADVASLFDAAEAAFGQVDVLVNNAGVFRFGPFEETDEEDIRRQFEVNVFGTLLTCREAARRFGPAGGAIVNLSSIGSRNVSPGMVVYSATKGAIDTITEGLSRGLGPRNIRVNSIAPGAIDTEGLAGVGFVEGSDMRKAVLAATPLGRIGMPDDVARLAVFLASDASSFVSGERVMAAGGWR